MGGVGDRSKLSECATGTTQDGRWGRAGSGVGRQGYTKEGSNAYAAPDLYSAR